MKVTEGWPVHLMGRYISQHWPSPRVHATHPLPRRLSTFHVRQV